MRIFHNMKFDLIKIHDLIDLRSYEQLLTMFLILLVSFLLQNSQSCTVYTIKIRKKLFNFTLKMLYGSGSFISP